MIQLALGIGSKQPYSTNALRDRAINLSSLFLVRCDPI